VGSVNEHVAKGGVVVSGALAALALCGWVTGWLWLASLRSDFIPMAPNTAACFLVLTVATIWAQRPTAPRWVEPVAAIVVLAIAGASLVLRSGAQAVAAPHLGPFPLAVMSPITAVTFVAIACSLLAAPRWNQVSAVLALLTTAVGAIVTLGYGYDSPLLYAAGSMIPVALTTGLAFFALGLARVLQSDPSTFPSRVFAGQGVGPQLMRAFLPATLGLVLAMGWVTLLVARWSPNPAVLAAVLGLFAVGTVSLVVTGAARRLSLRLAAAEAGEASARDRAALLLSSAGEGICGLDTQGITTFVNPSAAKILGYEPLELTGKPMHTTVHHTRADGMPYDVENSPVHAVLKDGQPRTVRDEVFFKKDGALVPVEYVATPILEHGRVAGAVVSFNDVSQRRSLEEQLRHIQKMDAIGQLAGGVAHDFNNLLTVILSFSSFVAEDLGPEHPNRQDLDEVIASSHRAAALTRQLLAFSRRELAEPTVVNLNDVVSSAEKMLRRLIGEQVNFSTSLDPKVKLVNADPGHLEQVLLNLVVNARDAMPSGGTLVVETSTTTIDAQYVKGRMGAPPGEYVTLSVTDSGMGMDEATRRRIFEPFFTTKAKGKGTGLGLATVYGIVKQSGGDLWVYSNVGLGTTFRVHLPAVTTSGGRAAITVDAGKSHTGHETVLVIEDEEAIRAIVLRSLTEAGFRVLVTANPNEALNAAAKHEKEIHLVVCDVVLPQMDGPTLVGRLVQQRPRLRTLYMSGYSGGALRESKAAYLQKPFTPRQLLASVRAALDAPQND